MGCNKSKPIYLGNEYEQVDKDRERHLKMIRKYHNTTSFIKNRDEEKKMKEKEITNTYYKLND